MAKLGIVKNAWTKTKQDLQNHPDVVENKWLGDGKSKTFKIADASNKLITMIGSGFFNEPRYYDDSKGGNFSLSKQAQGIIDTAISIARSDNPRDLWVICQWAREELHTRTTPNVLAAIGAAEDGTKPWAREFIPKIAQRADEPLQVLSAYLCLRGRTLTNSLKRGLADAIANLSEWQILRYLDTEGHPNTKDLLSLVDRHKGYPISKELYEYIFNGVIIDPEVTPVAFARTELAKRTAFDATSKELIRKGHIPWEVVVSQFGSKPEVWEFLVQNNLLGYMALLRNLRNLEGANISQSAREKVREKLVSGVEYSKQYPFRFLAARKFTSQNWTATSIDLALDESVKNVPDVPGKTVVLIDVSASMRSAVSGKSQMTCADVSASLGAILGKKYGADNVCLYPFAQSFERLTYSDADSVMNIVGRIERAQVGHATYAHLPVQDLINRKEKVDRIIILSDMQCYGSYGFGSPLQLQESILRYRQLVNRDVFIHSVDLLGYGDAQVDPKDKKVQLLGGWSENVFNLIRTFEGLETGEQVPAIEELRQRY